MSGFETRIGVVSLCAVTGYVYLTGTVDKYSVIDDPTTTTLLTVLFAAGILHLLTLSSSYIPLLNTRLHEYSAVSPTSPTAPSPPLPLNHPRRPLPLHPQLLSLLLLLRFWTLSSINKSAQCSTTGIFPYAAILIALWDLLLGVPKPEVANDEPEDMWGSVWDDVARWLQTARLPGFVNVVLVAWAASSATRHVDRSSFFCADLDGRGWVVTTQLLGVFLDMFIVVLLWRVTWWSPTLKSRIRILSDVLSITGLGLALFVLKDKFSAGGNPYSFSLRIALHDGIVLAWWLLSLAQTICMVSLVSGPMLVISTLGITASVVNAYKLGTWQQLSRTSSIGPLFIILVALFLFASSMEYSQLGLRSRAILYFVFVFALLATIITSFFGTDPFGQHPVKRLIYESRIESDRWMLKARESQSVRVAIDEYKARYQRDPPEGFDKWFNYAIEKDAAVIDSYDQINADFAPFWRFSAEELKKRTQAMNGDPDVALVTIKDGSVTVKKGKDVETPELDDMVSLIGDFAKDLPEMTFAVNLASNPRILPSDARVAPSHRSRHSKRDEPKFSIPKPWQQVYASNLHSMFRTACPPWSPIRQTPTHGLSEHCDTCAAHYTQDSGMFLNDFPSSLDGCLQADIFQLHSFFQFPPTSLRVYDKLMPLFGKSKTGGFADILIPMDEVVEQDTAGPFDGKNNVVFWRGYFSEPAVQMDRLTSNLGNEDSAHRIAFRGDLQHRLVRKVNDGTDMTTLFLTGKDTWGLEYTHLPTSLLNSVLPFDVAFAETSPICNETFLSCDDGLAELVTRPAGNTYGSRFVMHPDTPLGPSPEILRTLHSTSAPMIPTIFRTWYSDRLLPWVHFIPIDIRLHNLHAVASYFTGISLPPDEAFRGDDREAERVRKIVEKMWGGRRVSLGGAVGDGRWVAEEGQRWARKALRREDRAVYLFRVLLEWGRLVGEGSH